MDSQAESPLRCCVSNGLKEAISLMSFLPSSALCLVLLFDYYIHIHIQFLLVFSCIVMVSIPSQVKFIAASWCEKPNTCTSKSTVNGRLAALFAAIMFILTHAVLFDAALASVFVELDHERYGADLYFHMLPFAPLQLGVP